MRMVGINELAELTGKRRHSIRPALAAAGIEPKPGPNRSKLYPSDRALEVLYTGADRLDPGQEKAALDRVRRRLAELQVAEREGTLVSRAAVTEEWAASLLILRQKLLAQPTRFAAAIGTTAAERAHIEHEAKLCVRALLTELSTPAGEHVHVEETPDPVG